MPTASESSCSICAPHGEVVTVRDGKVTEMVVYPTVDDALDAVGLDENS